MIETIDGRPIAELVEEWRPYYAASNEPTRLRYMAASLTRGEPGPVAIGARGPDGAFEVNAERVSLQRLDGSVGQTHDLPGDTFQRLPTHEVHASVEVAYLKLSSVVLNDVNEYIFGAQGADVLVVDIRNYPSAFMPFALGGRLVSEPTQFVNFTRGDLSNPGAFRWTGGPTIQPLQPSFDGPVVVLVDEMSLSQSEYTAMALRANPRAVVVGSTTAGADGNVSQIPLPGGLQGLISGIGVFYPDRSPTQRVGIVPDIEVLPTIQGIREGRDEVLEAGVSHVLGREWRMAVP